MSLTCDYKKIIAERSERDPGYAKPLFDEAATLFLKDKPEMACVLLRDLVNVTLGFEHLAKLTDTPSRSLRRMLSPTGNPSMDYFAAIFATISGRLKVSLQARTVKLA